jgi:uncharacterized protein with GYD domain
VEEVAMGKYAILGGYTSEAWAKMIDNPGTRTAAVGKLVESVGGKLDQVFWSFGEDDFLVICEAPDDIAAGAAAVAAGSSGTLRNVRTIRLFTQDEGLKLLEKAKAAKAVYAPPGTRQAAGVR